MIELLGLGYFGIFILSFTLNLLPFMSPSNLILSGAVGVVLPWTSPLLVGFLIALASAFAKLIHFYLSFFTGKALKLDDTRLEGYQQKMSRVGPVLLFIAAATPVPDEPIVIPLGLMKYNPIKFFTVFFSGKILITTLGAFLGSSVSLTLGNLIGDPRLIVLSVIFTLIATYVLVKVDFEDLARRVLWKARNRRDSTNNGR